MSKTSTYTYRFVSRHETTLLPSVWKHCVHVMIYSELPKGFPISHAVMVSYNLLNSRLLIGSRHSRLDQEKFLEDSL